MPYRAAIRRSPRRCWSATGGLRRPGRRAVRRAAGRRQGVVVRHGLRQADLRPRGRLRRAGLLRLRGRLSVRARARRPCAAARPGPGAMADSQPLARPAGRRPLRSLHQLRRLGQHELHRTARRAALPARTGSAATKGTGKHFSVFGGGRMYTHTAEGKIFAVEQETGRLLWRRYFPGVHISYTTSRLLPRDGCWCRRPGCDACRLRCLDAATGKLLWEAPFSGSPSWNRQQPPVIYKNLAHLRVRHRQVRAGPRRLASTWAGSSATRTSRAFRPATGRWCGPTTWAPAGWSGPAISPTTAPAATRRACA